jgi:GTP-binding protein
VSLRGNRVVAIVGRPNVGKSTLFNALIGRRLAIVDDQPGVTRDRVYHALSTTSGDVLLVDTGGLLIDPRDGIELGVKEQALLACEEADFVLFVVDGRIPPTTDDEAIARLLQQGQGRVAVVANKIDDESGGPLGLAYSSLGLGDPLLVSALGRRGLTPLREEIARALPPAEAWQTDGDATAVAIVGKPNVGKSSLLNRLVGSQRSVVDDRPGTTRDAIDTVAVIGSRKLRLIDTAGIRRRSTREEGIGYYAYLRALGALERCEVAALVYDAESPDLEIVEVKLAQQAMLAGKAVVLIVNKWDLIQHGTAESFRWKNLAAQRLGFLRRVQIRYVSAQTGRGMRALPGVFTELAARRSQRISGDRLAAALEHVRTANPPPSNRGRLNRLRSISQEPGQFPLFRIGVDDPAGLPASYVRYLRNTLSERLNLDGIGFHLELKQRPRRGR